MHVYQRAAEAIIDDISCNSHISELLQVSMQHILSDGIPEYQFPQPVFETFHGFGIPDVFWYGIIIHGPPLHGCSLWYFRGDTLVSLASS